MLIFNIDNLDILGNVASSIISKTIPNRNFAFYGDMGIGKTTLIKALSLHLGVKDIVSSPTFSIVNEYLTQEGEKIYHFDFYRIENEVEAYDMGCEEYLFNPNYCFIEWAERIPNLIDDHMIKIYMYFKNNKRIVEVKI